MRNTTNVTSNNQSGGVTAGEFHARAGDGGAGGHAGGGGPGGAGGAGGAVTVQHAVAEAKKEGFTWGTATAIFGAIAAIAGAVMAYYKYLAH